MNKFIFSFLICFSLMSFSSTVSARAPSARAPQDIFDTPYWVAGNRPWVVSDGLRKSDMVAGQAFIMPQAEDVLRSPSRVSWDDRAEMVYVRRAPQPYAIMFGQDQFYKDY